MRIFTSIMILGIKAYQWFLSPALKVLFCQPQGFCRHVPTCSHYAIEAYRKHSFFMATYYVIHRVLRCHPWGTEGYDPVPENSKCGCKEVQCAHQVGGQNG